MVMELQMNVAVGEDRSANINIHAKSAVIDGSYLRLWGDDDRRQMVGQFKPHPSVYRFAAKRLKREPEQIMMVASHSFDILGARHSGFRGAYVNRYDLPYDESEYRPDLSVVDFYELCEILCL